MEDHAVKKLQRDMDGIRIDSAAPTETESVEEKDGDDSSNEHALFELCLTTRKGLGLFATQDIRRGTRIIAEPALITVPASEADFEHLWKGFKTLTHKQHDEMCDLSFVAKTVNPATSRLIRFRLRTRQQYSGKPLDAAVDDEKVMRAIFNTNGVAMGTSGRYGKGLFLLSSRLNHSCVPNVYTIYNATLGMTTVHASQDIKQGEELTQTYIQHVRNSPGQRAEILEHWAFKCDCPSCEGPEVAMREKRRRKIVELATGLAKYDLGMTSYATPNHPNKALAWAEEVVARLKEQGLEDMELAPAYRKCSKYCVQLGQLEKAMAYARKELEIQRYCLGTETAHLERDMEGAEFWIKHLEHSAEADRVKIAMNQKRTKKEDKRAEKKAAKKAGKGRR